MEVASEAALNSSENSVLRKFTKTSGGIYDK